MNVWNNQMFQLVRHQQQDKRIKMNKLYYHILNEDILFVQYMLYIFHTIVMHCKQQV